jgi:hypothetical protein
MQRPHGPAQRVEQDPGAQRTESLGRSTRQRDLYPPRIAAPPLHLPTSRRHMRVKVVVCRSSRPVRQRVVDTKPSGLRLCGIRLRHRDPSDHARPGARQPAESMRSDSDADVVASAKDYVDEVEAMFERVSTVNVAEMTATIEQGLSNLEAARRRRRVPAEGRPMSRARLRREVRPRLGRPHQHLTPIARGPKS